VQNAAAAWTNDAGSQISIPYTGTVASDPGNSSNNGVSAVVFDDPTSVIAGSFNCSSGGILAIGGPFFTGSTTAFAGQNFHTAIEGFVITQDGAACFYNGNSGLNGTEVLTHEIGHTLGLGHSCGDALSPACSTSAALDDAIMRASAHGDGRGGSIRSDDQAAALFLYPGANPNLFKNGFE
jgi:Metallo-peptidase family M12B Reprolysin-like